MRRENSWIFVFNVYRNVSGVIFKEDNNDFSASQGAVSDDNKYNSDQDGDVSR